MSGEVEEGPTAKKHKAESKPESKSESESEPSKKEDAKKKEDEDQSAFVRWNLDGTLIYKSDSTVTVEYKHRSGETRTQIMKAQLLCLDPLVVTLTNFMSEEDCKEIDDLAKSADWRRSRVGRGEGRVDEVRTSSSTAPPQGIANELASRLICLCGMKRISVQCDMVSYSPGQSFQVHHDGENRRYTCVLYLTDAPPPVGENVNDYGATYFPHLKLSIKPKRGSALFFRNTLPNGDGVDQRAEHQAQPSTVLKTVLNCWIKVPDC
jgi:prolyl 4-hydroxylase